MTLKEKIYTGLAVVAIAGGIGGIVGTMIYDNSIEKPTSVVQVSKLEYKLGPYSGGRDCHVATIETPLDKYKKCLNEKKESLQQYEEALQQYEDFVSEPEVVATLEAYDTEKERRGRNSLYGIIGSVFLMAMGTIYTIDRRANKRNRREKESEEGK